MALFGLGKKQKETQEEISSAVKILGSGCAACNSLELNTKKALQELGQDTAVEHVTDFAKIASYGVMSTPALMVDGKVLSSGLVLGSDEVAALIKKARDLG
ncbi:MAG: thioredoxin family protein [Sphaerochaeta sp.]|jgi:small redox-active disulfide protein 2|uniref:thioredoxin family protein n=1 Tax=Sphaerochaeta sp. TaxID=1972642 RepID=UPI002FCBEC4B